VPTATLPATVTPAPVDRSEAYARARRLGRGVNLGNALEAPREGEWGVTLQEAYFPLIAEAGFDTVRVPIRWSAHAATEPPYAIDEAFFRRVDWAIDQATAQGLNVVINMHHYNGIAEAPSAHEARFLAMWRQIAARYAGRPDTLYLEPLNEPHGALSAVRWNRLLAETLAVIREVDGVHTVVVDAADWGHARGLSGLRIPERETNVICSFHTYEPMLFTHQGAEWMSAEYQTLGVVWPGPPEEELAPVEGALRVGWTAQWFRGYNEQPTRHNPAGPQPILRELDSAVAYGEQLDCPLWLGEFGAYGKAGMDSRVRWTAFVREEAEKRGIPWAYWEFGAGFGVYDREAAAWREELLRALIPEV
jgi:endoglucanase